MLHSHSINALLATVLDPDSSEFRVTELEMIKVGRDSVCACASLGVSTLTSAHSHTGSAACRKHLILAVSRSDPSGLMPQRAMYSFSPPNIIQTGH